jgi:biopolymer transport protein ExbB
MMISSVLLQITSTLSDTLHAAPAIAAEAPQSLSFLDLILKGGIIMVPIGLLSMLGVYVFIERLITIKKASRVDVNFMPSIRDYVLNGNIPAAIALCKNTQTPVARMIEKGLKRIGKPIKEIEDGIESVGKLEVYKLEKNVGLLGTVAGVAPLFGFLGTIFGVIKIFYNIALADNISIGRIADGLYVKMITSAAGLMVGILAFIAHHILVMMVDKVVNKMEINAVEFIDLLQEPSKGKS